MTLSVHLVQPIVPSYRLPVFRRLAAAPGVDLTVWADAKSNAASLQGVTSDEGFRIRAAPMRRIGPFFWQAASITAATSGPDVLLLSWASRSLDLPFALRAARRRGVATVLWGHGFGTSHPFLGDLRRSKSRNAADAFLLYGPAGRERLANAGFAPDRLFVAPNAIDQSVIAEAAADWRAEPSRTAAFRAEHGLGEDPILLYVARLEPEKLPQLAIEALAILRRSTPARLVFIGDGVMRGDLERLARDRGVGNSVTFLGALYNEAAIAPWACSASCLVHPGAIGLSIFHAFGYGLPVVTSDRIEIQMPEFETHRDGVNGFRYRHGDAEDLAVKITSLLEDDALRCRMSESALDTVSGSRGRNVEGMVAGFLEAIDFAAARHGKSRL